MGVVLIGALAKKVSLVECVALWTLTIDFVNVIVKVVMYMGSLEIYENDELMRL